jgi:hypothetical protein
MELSVMDRFRGEVGGVDTVAQRAEQLMAMVNNQEVDDYQLRCSALDLMCASFPLDHPLPKALIRVMKLALKLPENHHTGRWWDDFWTPRRARQGQARQPRPAGLGDGSGHRREPLPRSREDDFAAGSAERT